MAEKKSPWAEFKEGMKETNAKAKADFQKEMATNKAEFKKDVSRFKGDYQKDKSELSAQWKVTRHKGLKLCGLFLTIPLFLFGLLLLAIGILIFTTI